ncbi:hypothetical protein CEK62_07975 [Alcanivorax sp. N3-2A]|nr:hypothetical protein CEK62_07975 [Alcanivorax sp. N3-2A]|tara:strand:+ start:121813 stop:124029 length:2217 start_codon:yes stop_codon:yes gene_type:complete
MPLFPDKMDFFVALLALLKILFLLAVVGISLYSLIGYKSRRRQSRQALSSLQRESVSIRRLDPGEREALLPHLRRPEKPGKALTLDSEEVFVLEGAYQQHGLESNGNKTLHDTIGGVEVLLPYDARLFLTQDNRAEVVFADNLAAVVRLNDEFTLLEGRERDQRRAQADDQWQSGVRGEIGDVFDVDDGAQSDDEARRRRVDIVDQRDETEAEIFAREGRGLGLLSGLFWLLGFAGLWIASWSQLDGSRPLWLAGGLISIALALWLFWRPWKPGPARKVNVVSGALDLHLIRLEEGGQAVSAGVTLGDKLPFDLPAHWRPHVQLEEGRTVEAELRVDDHGVVRWDRHLSLDKEVRQVPPVFWGRHLTLAILGGLALLGALLASAAPSADLALAWSALTQHGPRQYGDAQALMAQPPGYATPVSLRGSGRCQVRREGGAPLVDCRRIRWGGAQPAGDTELNDETAQALIDGEFLNLSRDPRLEMLALLQGNRDPKTRPMLVKDLPAVVALVDRACPEAMSQYRSARPCDLLRWEMVKVVKLPRESQPGDWAAFHDAVLGASTDAAQNDAQGTPDEAGQPMPGVILHHHVDKLLGYAREAGFQRADKAVRRLADEIIDSQTGGVVIQVPEPIRQGAPSEQSAGQVWRQMVALAGASGQTRFQIDGVVVRRGETADGAVRLEVDTRQRLDQPWPALVRSAWLLLAAALLLVHAPLAWRFRMARRRRQQALAELYGWSADQR